MPGGHRMPHTFVLNPGGEEELYITGYLPNIFRTILTYIVTVIFAGIPLLVFRWKPAWKLELTCRRVSLRRADRLLTVHKESGDMAVVFVHQEEVTDQFPREYRVTKRETNYNDRTGLLDSQQLTTSSLRFFLCRNRRYVWNEERQIFLLLSGLKKSSVANLKEMVDGLSETRAENIRQLHGPNSISVPVPSYLALLLEEVLHPFYIFQLCSLILWSLDNYILYAGCILTISLISVSVSLYETRRQAEMLHNMIASGIGSHMTVLRSGVEKQEDSGLLCPGDVLRLPPQGCLLPCDAVLLTGSAIVNEAMLTGESVPVTKVCLEEGEEAKAEYAPDSHRRHTLFAGTEVIQTRYYGDQAVLALVVRTGFNTAKGELIRSILFPKPMDFKFYQDSIRFICVLFCIAGIGMVYCVYMYIKREVEVQMILLRTLDIITIVVPPALPAAMTVGTVYAQARLRRGKIFCLSPARINVCGKLKLVCFDKTGTLTEDGLDMWGVIPSVEGTLGDPIKQIDKIDKESLLQANLAACHSLIVIDGKVTGDPLDLRMFESTGWELKEGGVQESETYDQMMPTVVRPKPASEDVFSIGDLPLEIGISRQFTFSSNLARMSVIAKKLRSKNFIILTKGAPEKIEELCLSSTIPSDFNKKLAELARAGFRVVALAGREISVNFLKVQKMTRDDAEKDLIFLGFLVMQNTLKPESAGVINELKTASLRCLMVTGDNLLTAVSVSRDCGLIGDIENVMLVSHKKQEDGTYKLEFAQSEKERDDMEVIVMERNKLVPHLAITGRTWLIVREHFQELVPWLLLRTTVWARMSPDQKAGLVEELQSLGYVAAMCGDGANDCGALKAAHVGVSLSEAEASVAAPFTSAVPNISCIPSLVKEGRCALATSFGVFKYMALYSMIQFASVLILYSNKTNLGDSQFLYIDLAITTTVAVLMGRTGPWNKLVKQRPPGSLMAGPTMASILLQILLCFGGQIGATLYLHQRAWYTPVEPKTPDEEILINWDTTTVFIVSSYQYLSLATVFSTGPPYRKPFYTNFFFLGSLILLSGTTAILLFNPFPSFGKFFGLLLPFPEEEGALPYKWFLLFFVLVNSLANFAVELAVTTGKWVKKLAHIITCKKGPRNKYKNVLRELEWKEEQEGESWPKNLTTYYSQTYS